MLKSGFSNILVALFCLLLTMPLAHAQDRRASTLAGKSTVYAPNGVIATSHPLASTAGLAVLQEGGNAIDAAVTAAVVLNLVEPHASGIGGDMFAILWSAEEQKLIGLNASGRAGSLMTREEMLRRGHDRIPFRGAEPITVPGALSGWVALLERHGTISLARAFEPAIQLAKDGFPVSPIIAKQWAAEVEILKQDVGASATFLIDGERAPREGEWYRNPDFAHSLQMIVDQGPEVFYGGELGAQIVDRVKALGGFLTLDDLKNHRAEWVEPVSVPFRGYRLWELPPNGQGIAALEMLRILEPYDFEGMGHNSASYLHHLIEAKKIAFADLAQYVGDPDYMTVSTGDLLADTFIESRREKLNPNLAAEHQDPGEIVTGGDTIYLAAADQFGNMISFINSIYWEFGSGVVVPGTGFVLQDRGAGFTLKEGLANTLAPGKRPFHTIIPPFVTRTGADGSEEPWLSYGVMGGSMQPQAHVQVLLNIVVFGMDLQEAIDAPRFRHQSGNRVALEAPISAEVRSTLTSMGHVIVDESTVSFGGAQAIMRLDQGWAAASDPRKDGMAVAH